MYIIISWCFRFCKLGSVSPWTKWKAKMWKDFGVFEFWFSPSLHATECGILLVKHMTLIKWNIWLDSVSPCFFFFVASSHRWTVMEKILTAFWLLAAASHKSQPWLTLSAQTSNPASCTCIMERLMAVTIAAAEAGGWLYWHLSQQVACFMLSLAIATLLKFSLRLRPWCWWLQVSCYINKRLFWSLSSA